MMTDIGSNELTDLSQTILIISLMRMYMNLTEVTDDLVNM